jgi:hypothetical protein
MKRLGGKRGLLLQVIAVLLVLWGSDAAPVEAQPPAAERPTYATGQQWILTDGVYDLVRIEKDAYVFAASPTREIHLNKDLVVTRVVKDGVVEWDLYPVRPLSWPLQAGKWGTFQSTLRTRDHRSGVNVTVTWRVGGLTSVTSPAGVFQALPISYKIEVDTTERRGRLGVSGRLRWDVVEYYAPATRALVKVDAQGVDALNLQLAAVEPRGPAIALTLSEPKDQLRVTRERVGVEGAVIAHSGIARLSVAVNGSELLNRRPTSRQTEMPIRLPVTLREGKNVVVVGVEDGTGAKREETRVVFYEKPVAGATPAPREPEPGPSPAPDDPGRRAHPLTVTISTPADQARVDQDGVTLSGVAFGGRGVTRVVIALNGLEVKRLEERTPQQKFSITLPLQLKEGSNTLVVSATDAGGTVQQDVRTIIYEKVAPLALDVRFPEDRSRVADASSLVAAVVTSSRGVTNITVTLNGTPQAVPKDEPARTANPKSVAVTVPLTLREGPNAIVITATDAGGDIRHELRTVTYERPQPAGPAPTPESVPAPTMDRWAVVIGVGRYERSEITPLQYTVADAEAVYESLVSRGSFRKENVLLMTDKTEKKPTLRNVKWALGTFLARSAKKDDLVVIYFSGHGAPEVDPRGIESDGLAKYLVPIDADPGDLYSTALPMEELQTIFERIEARRVVVLLDSCYSGAAGGRTFASRRTKNTRVDDLFLDRLTRSSGRVIITAARAAEVSIELPELGHGIFTHYLLQGFKGSADLDRDGIVALQELYQYLEQQVSQKSRAAGGNQHPVLKGEVEGVLPLVKVGGQ